MKKLLVLCLLLMPLMNCMEIKAEEPEDNKGCILEIDENGEILNLEEYEECISELIEPTWGNDDKGPRQ